MGGAVKGNLHARVKEQSHIMYFIYYVYSRVVCISYIMHTVLLL